LQGAILTFAGAILIFTGAILTFAGAILIFTGAILIFTGAILIFTGANLSDRPRYVAPHGLMYPDAGVHLDVFTPTTMEFAHV